MSTEVLIAIVATVLATGMILFLGIRLVQALVLYRLMRTVREYPNIAMALALAARGDDDEANRFRTWVTQSIDTRGWGETDTALSTMLSQLYPLSNPDLFSTTEPRHASESDVTNMGERIHNEEGA